VVASAFEAARLYDVIHQRRDVRREFSGEPIDEEVLHRILGAGHAAPSVGLTQPWDFIRIESQVTRHAFWEHVHDERRVFESSLDAAEAATFAGIKIDGILEASLSLVVTYDERRGAPHVLGRHAIAEAGPYSVCLAIQNIWLAATAERWGLGWVSFYREAFLASLLGLPAHVRPIAWLCLGPTSRQQDVPDLERAGWRTRRALSDAIHVDRWSPPVA
jgi:5,6-dimethylbenzimidazole synthase